MTATSQGSVRLFRLAGIDVFLHWSWFLVAYYEISQRAGWYSSPVWNVLEYVALFGIVLLHEFGHSLACRQVGGRANRIVLWPLGGVAFVEPPERPGAILWSLAAGPLVNVALAPVLIALAVLLHLSGAANVVPDVVRLVDMIAMVNAGLLVFNLMPVYPLDGGQILRSLLWFVLGRAWSLTVVTVLGFFGVAALVVLALATRNLWLGVIALFILFNCWGGLQYALRLMRVARAPRREGFTCPTCRNAPPAGAFWACPRCGKTFDTFETGAVCPNCQASFATTSCPECGSTNPLGAWSPSTAAPPPELA